MQQGAKLLRSEGIDINTGIEFSIYFFPKFKVNKTEIDNLAIQYYSLILICTILIIPNERPV